MNNDSISRQAAIDEIEYELEMINSALDSITLDFNARERLRQRRGEAREILNSIQQLPSVQLERKTGKWIRTRTMIHDGELYCDQCGQEHPEQKKIWNFCPNCGADMREGDAE